MNFKKSISFVLTMCMVFSLFATFVLPVAAEGTTYTMIDTVEDLKAGTYYMAAYIEKDGYDPYQLFNGIGSGKGYTTGYTYADGVLATTATQYLAEAVEVAAVEGKENTYTIYLEGKGYVTCTDGSANHKLNFSDTACEWEAYANANGGINFKTTVGSNVAHMGTNVTSTSQFIRQYKDSSAASSLSYGLVFFAEDVEEVVPPVTSKVVENWNHADWNTGINTFDAAYIFTDAAVYAETDMLWWNHAAFAPTETEGMYEVTEVALNGSDAAKESSLTIPEGGFVWVGWSGAAAESSGKYAFDFIAKLTDGDKVTFYGIDIANCTTTADAYAEKYVEPVDPNAPVSIAIGKKCIYPTAGLYYHWDAKWECSKYVETALTDGVKEAGYYGVGETSGWGGGSPNPLEIVVDLEKLYDIDSFAYTLIGGGRDGIAFPASTVISVSKDNADYTVVEGTIDTGKESSSDCYDRTYTVSLDTPVTGRYVKFSFTKTGNFAFINELEVFGEESASTEKVPVNVAFDKEYEISGNGKPYGNYTASLTDGVAQEKLSYDGNWFTFYHNTGESAAPNINAPDKVGYVIIDLGGLYDLSSVKAHCYDGLDGSATGGIKGPKALKIYLSEDKETWSDAIVVETPTFDAATDFWTETAVSGKVQYVKFEAELNGVFAFINEIEVWGTEADVPAEEDDDSFKDTFTYVDGVNKGTAQSREDGWESIPVVDFWYLVEDGVDTVTIKVAVDNKKVVADDTMFRIWIDADLDDIARTALYDFKVDADGKIYDATKPTNCIAGGYTSAEYTVIGNDYYFTVVLDKAVIGIDGQYGLDLQLGQANHNTLHSIEWDAFDNALVPWSTTEFYEVFGDADTFKNDYTYVDGEIVGTTQSRADGWESIPGADFWYKVTDTEEMVFVYVMVDNRNVLPGVLNADKPTQLDSGTSLRLWIDADLSSPKERTTLVDVAYIDGLANAYRVDNGFAAAVSTDFAVDGNDYGFCVVLDKAALGIDGQYGMMLTLSETGYNSMHNVAWDVYDVANCAPWNTTKDYIVYGTSEEPAPEEPTYNEGWNAEFDADEIKIFKGDISMFGDGKWGEDAVAYNNEAVILIQNLVCKNPELYPVFSLVYNAGEAIDLNNIKLGIYAETNSMIGYPSKDVKVYVSNDGIEWTLVESTNEMPESVFGVFHDPANSRGTSLVEIVLAETVNAQYVKVDFTYTDSPFTDPSDYKPVYEFISFTEAEVRLVEDVVVGEDHVELLPDENATVTGGEVTVNEDGSVTITIGETGKVEVSFDLVDAKFYPVTGAYAIYDYATVGNVTKVETLAQYTRADKGENTAQLYLSGMNGSSSYYVSSGEGWGVWSLTNYITGGKLFADGVHEVKSMTYTIEGEAGASVVFYTFGIYDSEDAVKGLGSVRPEEDNDNVVVPDGYGSADVLVDGYTGAGEIFGYEGNQAKLFAFNYLVANAEYSFTVSFETNVKFDSITLFGLDYANGCVVIPEKVAFVVNGNSYEATIVANPNGIARMFVAFEEAVTADEITVVITTDGNANFFNMFTEIKVSEVTDEEVITSDVVTDFNLGDWTDGKFGADAAVIFTDADIYAAANQIWWFHAAFAPTSIEGVYEVVATRGASQDAFLTIPEGGFVWVAHDTAAEGTAGAFAFGMISTLKVGDRVVFNGVDFENATTKEDATAEKVVAPESVDIKVSHNNLYNWGTFESMIISEAGKTVTEVIGQTPYWWIMYVVEEVDGVYVATEFYKNCDEINTTVCPENGFLFYVYSSNSNWADADYGKLLGCYFILGDIDLSAKFAIDTQKGEEPYIMQVVSGFKTGDANMNGKIDANDYALARKAVIGKVELTDAQIKLLDVNGNGKVDANDYMLIKRHVLGTYTIPAWADVE